MLRSFLFVESHCGLLGLGSEQTFGLLPHEPSDPLSLLMVVLSSWKSRKTLALQAKITGKQGRKDSLMSLYIIYYPREGSEWPKKAVFATSFSLRNGQQTSDYPLPLEKGRKAWRKCSLISPVLAQCQPWAFLQVHATNSHQLYRWLLYSCK